MERESSQTFVYDWQQANPSDEVALPVIMSAIFDEGEECYWMAERSYATEDMLTSTLEYYKNQFPNLFDQLSAFAVVRAHSPGIFVDLDETMKYYYRGAVVAIRALEASTPNEYYYDISQEYAKKLSELDSIDTEQWLVYMRAATAEQTEQLRNFIDNDYEWLVEPEHLKTAMHIGAQYAYILTAHSRACLKREEELAWGQHKNSTD